MKIHFHGAARTVTGSQYLLEINNSKVLLECGLFQGRRSETYEKNRGFKFDPSELDAVILSHAHIDHSGNLPNLVKSGYKGKIYATPPTVELAKTMLLDSGHIQEADIQFVNKHRARRGETLLEPLYTIEDAEAVGKFFQPEAYEHEFSPIPGVTATLVDAGHILGSAAVVLDIQERDRKFRLWFSGDIGRLQLPLLRDPVMPVDADYLIMECTYGDKSHHDPQQAYNELRDVIIRTVDRHGKIIIPAFSVGRTQELVYMFNEMIQKRQIESLPVYVDSPLAVNASDIFRKYPEYFDSETREFVQTYHHPALNFEKLTYTRSVAESKAINDRKESAIIISASGMSETGRILHHLRNNIENPANTILIVSWQAPHTLGRRLADRNKEAKIFGLNYDVRAEVVTIGGLSAHADQETLVDYASHVKNIVKQIYLVHGEQKSADALRDKLRENGITQVTYPDIHQNVEI
ncbi:MAG: MBL fold metallo-hydrolase [Chloroflexota bacterium]